jgi:hypothetical protein
MQTTASHLLQVVLGLNAPFQLQKGVLGGRVPVTCFIVVIVLEHQFQVYSAREDAFSVLYFAYECLLSL